MAFHGPCHVPRTVKTGSKPRPMAKDLEMAPRPELGVQDLASPDRPFFACDSFAPMLFWQKKEAKKTWPKGFVRSGCTLTGMCKHMLLATLAPHQKTGPQEFLRNRASAITGLLAHNARGWAGLRTCIMHHAPPHLCTRCTRTRKENVFENGQIPCGPNPVAHFLFL